MILDQFYLLFKTDASGASGDIKKLDDQISQLAAKGKKRSDQETLDLKEMRKQRALALQDLKDQQSELDKIGQSFSDIAVNALGALAAYASFSGIKNGVLDAAKLNSGLEVQAEITGQNIDELRAYSAAVQDAGGSSQGFIQTVDALTVAAAKSGVTFTKVGDLFDYYHNLVAGLDKGEQRRILTDLFRVTDPGAIALLEKQNGDYRERIRLAKEISSASKEDYENARLFEQESSRAGSALTSIYTRLGSDILPTVSKALIEFRGYIKDLEGDQGGIEGFFTKVAAAATLLVAPLRAIAAGFLVASEVGQAITDVQTGSRESVLSHLSAGAAKEIDAYLYGPRIIDQTKPIPAPPSGALKEPKVTVTDANGNTYSGESIAEILKTINPSAANNSGTYRFPDTNVANSLSIPQYQNAGRSGMPSLSVKIDSINIDTQATNGNTVAQEFSTALKGHLDDMWSDWNDGMDR